MNFVRRRMGDLTWEIRSEEVADELAPILNDPEAFLQDRSKHFKSSRVVTVARVSFDGGERPLVLRRLNYGKLIHRLRDVPRPSRARRAFRHGLLLEMAGVATPRALAAADARVCGWPTAAYLVTEEITEAVTLRRWVDEGNPLERVAERMGKLIASIHQAGFSHRDLKATNLLVGSNGDVHVIDLDGLRKSGRLTERRRQADLDRLRINFDFASVRMKRAASRFAIAYCHASRMEVERMVSGERLSFASRSAAVFEGSAAARSETDGAAELDGDAR